jgi:ectoine hydroxylase-related dioxygenase (phytanoyl-CoA dioxygenase family)
MDTRYANSKEDIAKAKVDRTDWNTLSKAERIRNLELEGYVAIPNLIEPSLIKKIREELDKLPTEGADYSEHQRNCSDVQWTDSPHIIDLIANPKITTFLTDLLGDELICTSVIYALSRPGHPGIAIHTDCQPYGSKIFGGQASSPCLVRVLYYLDDLTPLRSPLKVIPRSHLSLHADANPYNRYLANEDEVMVTCPAGSAAIINQKVFHANYPNHSNEDRRLLAIAYRPSWAGPISDVPDKDPEKVKNLPPNIKPFFKSLNTRNINFDVPNRPNNMAENARGISPQRWSH